METQDALQFITGGGSQAATTPTPVPTTTSVQDFLTQGTQTQTPASPPLREWPGIIGRTMLHALQPGGYGEYAAEAGGFQGYGLKVPDISFQDWMKAAPPEPEYGGALGFAQRYAQTAAGPAAPLAMAFPVTTLVGDTAAEGAKQFLGAGPIGQTAASVLGSITLPGMIERGTAAVGRAMARETEATATRMSDVLATQAGVTRPKINTFADHKDAVGQVLQDEAMDATSTTSKAATARAMQARAKTAQGKSAPATDAKTDYLNSIADADSPSAAVDAAIGDIKNFNGLSERSRTALGSLAARAAEDGTGNWLNMDPKLQRMFIPDDSQRAAVTAAAQRVGARAGPQAPAAASGGTTANELIGGLLRHYGPATLKHLIPGGGLYGTLSMLGLPSPLAEMTSVGATLLGRQLIKRPGAALTGATVPQDYSNIQMPVP